MTQIVKYVPWNKLILSLLILAIVIVSSGCQAGTEVKKSLQHTIDEFARLPQRLVHALTNLLSGLGDIGGALAEQIGNIIQNMTGR
jgi:hypothetical protein